MNKLSRLFSQFFALLSIILFSASFDACADEPIGAPLGKQIKISATKPSYNRRTGLYTTKLSITNKTRPKVLLKGALGLLIYPGLTPGVAIVNSAGKTFTGVDYIQVPLPAKGLKPGKSVKRIVVQFSAPPKARIKPIYTAYLGLASASAFSTNSGAIGVLALNNARIAFVPDATGIRPILLESSGNVALSANAPARTTAEAPTGINAAVQLTFNADACTVDITALKVICVGFDSTKIALLDVTKFISSLKTSDITSSEFESGAPAVDLSFSGGSCVLCGVAADPGDSRFVVAANDGYRIYSYGASAPTAVYPIPVNENFSFDSARNRIIAAEYDRSGRDPRALNIVDLNKAKVYRWTKDTSSCADLAGPGVTCRGVTSDVDSTAVDLSTGMVALIFEHSTTVVLVDMGQALFDDSTLSFSAPAFYTNTPTAPRQSGGSASTTGDFLFLSEELGDSHVGVMTMPAAAGTAGVFPALTPNPVFIDLSDVANPECDTSGAGSYRFATKGDPHGLALYTGLIGGKQTGLVIDRSNACAALVDLAGLSGAARSISDAAQLDPSVDLRATQIVRFVKL